MNKNKRKGIDRINAISKSRLRVIVFAPVLAAALFAGTLFMSGCGSDDPSQSAESTKSAAVITPETLAAGKTTEDTGITEGSVSVPVTPEPSETADPEPSGDIVLEGDCGDDGDNVKYRLCDNGELIISGSGKMENYGRLTDSPWNSSDSLIKTVIIEEGVESLGSMSFVSTRNIEKIILPSTLSEVGYLTLCDCSSLNEIVLSPENKYFCLEDGVLFDKDKTVLVHYTAKRSETYDIPSSVKTIRGCAFSGSIIKQLSLGSVEEIGAMAFYGCDIPYIKIPKTLKECGVYEKHDRWYGMCDGAFGSCKIGTIEFEEGTVDIPSEICRHAYVENVILHDGVKSVNGFDFSTLKKITLPQTVEKICRGAFERSELEEINLPDSVKEIGSCAFSCCDFSSIVLPQSIKSISENLFDTCVRLTEITVPESVTSIGSYAFNKCTELESITIPDSVKSIADTAFEECDKVIIYCKSGSYAEKYAAEKGIKYSLIS
ncbi:MAG: leucine-rich repeat protein [Clostridia bacterium]|nr:leucine-rich repeat protein [Clostridia bacterium]